MDIYEKVTERIIAELESGVIPWTKPWTGITSGAISHVTGKPYSLINQFLLGSPGEFLTFEQAKKENGHVKKGAKSKMAVFCKTVHRAKTDADGQIVRDDNGMPVDSPYMVLRYYPLFHLSDCEGSEAKWPQEKPIPTASPVECAEAVMDDYAKRARLTVEHKQQSQAYYSPRRHLVSLPMMEQFQDSVGYYDTAFHEITHSTGHYTLLNRFDANAGAAAFGSASYSKEELIAEIGACAILHELGLETQASFRNNAAYIQSWLRALKNDKHMIIQAASKAEKAVKLVFGIMEEQTA